VFVAAELAAILLPGARLLATAQRSDQVDASFIEKSLLKHAGVPRFVTD
jgi:hypothetical protein